MNDVEQVFDALGKASRLVCLSDKRAELVAQIKDVQSKRCGV